MAEGQHKVVVKERSRDQLLGILNKDHVDQGYRLQSRTGVAELGVEGVPDLEVVEEHMIRQAKVVLESLKRPDHAVGNNLLEEYDTPGGPIDYRSGTVSSLGSWGLSHSGVWVWRAGALVIFMASCQILQ